MKKVYNNWKEFKDFINANGEEGATFGRSLLHKALPHISKNTIDGYRSILQKGGFFESLGRGQYRLLHMIPENITWKECEMLARHENLDYLESRHNRMIRKENKEKNKFKIVLTEKDISDIEYAFVDNDKKHCSNQACCWGRRV
jgi:hypothetical protein